ncbi:MAG: O-antigen ligase family protein [Caldilineaceae bacterium]
MIRKLYPCVIEAGGLGAALLLPLIFNPWAALPFEPAKVTFLRFVVAGILVIGTPLALYQWYQTDRTWPSLTALFNHIGFLGVAAFGYGISVLIATYTSLDPRYSLWGGSDSHGAITTWCGLLLSLMVGAVIHNQKAVIRLLLALLAGSIPVCLYGFIQFGQRDPLVWVTDSVSPVLSTLGRSNFLAAYLAVVLPLTFVLWQESWQQRLPVAQISSSLLLAMQVMCLLLTQARAGWLAFVGGISVFLWASRWRQPLHQIGVRILFFLLLSLALFLGFSQIIAQVPSAPTQTVLTTAPEPSRSEQRIASIERRLLIWQHTLPFIGEQWLWGFGPEMFATIFNQRYPPGTLYTGMDTFVTDPHNVLLEQLVTLGVVGTTAWLLMISQYFLALSHLLRRPSRQKRVGLAAGLAGSMCAYLIQAQFNPDVVALEMLFWLLLAMATGLYKEAQVGKIVQTDNVPTLC